MSRCLLRVSFEAPGSLAELLQLSEDLLCFSLEFLLQDLDGLSITQFLLDVGVVLAEQGADLRE